MPRSRGSRITPTSAARTPTRPKETFSAKCSTKWSQTSPGQSPPFSPRLSSSNQCLWKTISAHRLQNASSAAMHPRKRFAWFAPNKTSWLKNALNFQTTSLNGKKTGHFRVQSSTPPEKKENQWARSELNTRSSPCQGDVINGFHNKFTKKTYFAGEN